MKFKPVQFVLQNEDLIEFDLNEVLRLLRLLPAFHPNDLVQKTGRHVQIPRDLPQNPN